NHTYDHLDLGQVDVRTYIANIEQMDRAFLVLDSFAPPIDQRRMFRYPYLQEGESLAKRHEIRDYLLKNQYRIAQVTIDAEDWLWSAAYERCLARRDDRAISWLKDHMAEAVEQHVRRAKAIARALFNREIAQILLLHANTWNALALDSVL